METKKILMVTSFYPPYHVGGACTHVYYLANELARRGNEVHVFHSIDAYNIKRNSKPNPDSYPNHENVILHPFKSGLGKISPIYSFMFGSIPLNRKVKELFDDDYDLIHYHNISLLGPQVFGFGKSKKIYTAHDHWLVCPLSDFYTNGEICNRNVSNLTCGKCLLENKRPIQFWRFSSIMKKHLEKIDMIISPSNYLRDFLNGFSINNHMEVILNFVPNPPQKLESIDEEDYFFYAGMLEPIKGIQNLVNAFRECKDKKLIIAGKGSLENYLRNFIKTKNLQNIKYVDFIHGKKIYSYYKNANAFILPSMCPENSPLTIIEAMSVGTVSIGSDAGGIPEMIRKIDDNLIFDYGDIEDLKLKINGFEKNIYDEKKIMRIFKKDYSPEIYVKRYMQAVDSV